MNTFSNDEIKTYYDKFKKIIFSYIKNLSKSEYFAEECCQEAFVRLCKQNKSRFSSEEDLKKWLFTVSKNVFLKKLRKESKYSSLQDDYDEISDEFSPREKLFLSEKNSLISQKIQKTLDKLCPRQKQALESKFFLNLPQNEIIKKVNAANSNACSVLINLAKKRFKHFWEKNLTSQYS